MQVRARSLRPRASAGLAEKFDIAERAAAQRIDAARPSLRRAFNGVDDVVCQRALDPFCPVLPWQCAQARCRALRGTTDMARTAPHRRANPASYCGPHRSSNFQMRCIPTPPARILRAPSPQPESERIGKAGRAMRHAVERSLAHALPDPAPAAFRAQAGFAQSDARRT